jgi:hypothetical protein
MKCRLSTLALGALIWGAVLPHAVTFSEGRGAGPKNDLEGLPAAGLKPRPSISAVRNAVHAAPTGQQPDPSDVQDIEEQGEHHRLETVYGPVHVWRPADYDARTAGIVIYIHGYYTSLDQTWSEDHLAEQFQASGRNATFIAPQSPRANYDEVEWKSLDVLLRTVDDRVPLGLPSGPVVVVGHSGAFRTILCWLDDPRVRDVILLDGLYHGQREFRYWLRGQGGGNPHRMVLVASMTSRQSSRLARNVPGAVRRNNIPEEFSGFTRQQVRARLLYMHSQYEHTDIVSSGKVIPVVLQLTPLKRLGPPQPPPVETLHHRASSTGR